MYATAVRTPKRTPSAGSSPYAPSPTTPEIRTTPISTIGTAAAIRAPGFSERKSQAAIGTSTTWTFPSTVASPAPTPAIEWCQRIRSAAKNAPAIQAYVRERVPREP